MGRVKDWSAREPRGPGRKSKKQGDPTHLEALLGEGEGGGCDPGEELAAKRKRQKARESGQVKESRLAVKINKMKRSLGKKGFTKEKVVSDKAKDSMKELALLTAKLPLPMDKARKAAKEAAAAETKTNGKSKKKKKEGGPVVAMETNGKAKKKTKIDAKFDVPEIESGSGDDDDDGSESFEADDMSGSNESFEEDDASDVDSNESFDLPSDSFSEDDDEEVEKAEAEASLSAKKKPTSKQTVSPDNKPKIDQKKKPSSSVVDSKITLNVDMDDEEEEDDGDDSMKKIPFEKQKPIGRIDEIADATVAKAKAAAAAKKRKIEEEQEEDEEESSDDDGAGDDSFEEDGAEDGDSDVDSDEADGFVKATAKKQFIEEDNLSLTSIEDALEGKDSDEDGDDDEVGDADDDENEDDEKYQRAKMPKKAVDPEALQQRIQDVLSILVNFKDHRQALEEAEAASNGEVKIRPRKVYIERLKKDLCAHYGYSKYMIDVFMDLFPPSGATGTGTGQDILQFLDANETDRPMTLRANTLKTRRRDLAQALINRGANVDPIGKWSKVGLVVYDSQVPIGATPEYLGGHYMLQGGASMLPAHSLVAKPDERILDMCSAPGGKTSHVAQLMRNTGILIANDSQPERQKATVCNLHRLGIVNTSVVSFDGRKLPGVFGRDTFDRVLLDAPCSGTGVVSKDPSVKHRTQRDIMRCARLQRELLLAAVDLAKPAVSADIMTTNRPSGAYGLADIESQPVTPAVAADGSTVPFAGPGSGVIVYSTCSVLVEENEDVIDYVLRKRPGAVRIVDSGLSFGAPGFTRFRRFHFKPDMALSRRYYPHTHNLDGFFVCKLQKIAPYSSSMAKQDKMENEEENEVKAEAPPMQNAAKKEKFQRGKKQVSVDKTPAKQPKLEDDGEKKEDSKQQSDNPIKKKNRRKEKSAEEKKAAREKAAATSTEPKSPKKPKSNPKKQRWSEEKRKSVEEDKKKGDTEGGGGGDGAKKNVNKKKKRALNKKKRLKAKAKKSTVKEAKKPTTPPPASST